MIFTLQFNTSFSVKLILQIYISADEVFIKDNLDITEWLDSINLLMIESTDSNKFIVHSQKYSAQVMHTVKNIRKFNFF